MIIHHGELILDGSVSALRRDYMHSREVDLKLGRPFDGDLHLPGVSVVKSKGYGVKLSVETAQTPIEAVVSSLLQLYPVQDITISHPPMEEIIATIYRGRKEGA